ncbi:YfjI family protein [Flavobacteriaceae bacterium]|nr:YfjI family protein [Flavobacteriaceae bacterium]MDA9907696.1 YfjI family protein [Flavobacteriaceae bacterium]
MSSLEKSLSSDEALHDKEQFPIDIYPNEIINIIKELKEKLGYPNEFIGASMLYTLSVAIGNTYRIKMKEGWDDSALIYVVLIGEAGVNKTHPLRWVTSPLNDYDIDNKKDYDVKYSSYDKTDVNSKAPNCKQTLIKNFTLESLMQIHQHNERGMGVYADELGSWFNRFDIYSKGDDKQQWLSIFNNEPIVINRKTNNEHIRIDKPFISVIGSIQPNELEHLAKGNKFNGFLDRMFFVKTNATYQSINNKTISHRIKENWSDIIKKILQIGLQYDTNNIVNPKEITLTDNAFNTLIKWDNQNAVDWKFGDELKSVIPKMKTYAIRFTLIIEILDSICENKTIDVISNDSVLKGIKLAEYYKFQQLEIKGILERTEVEKLTENKQEWYNALTDNFSRQDAMRLLEKFKENHKAIDRFIGNKKLFKRVRQGVYEKV